jgi:glutamyl-tRNA reductase
MNQVISISVNHKFAGLDMLVRFDIPKERRSALLDWLRFRFRLKGLLILVTCNRTEIYLETDKTTPHELAVALLQFRGLPTSPRMLDKFEYRNSTSESLAHLVKVAAGLESTIYGDTQVISQVKEAYRFSLENKLQGSRMEKMMQQVFRIYKKVVNDTFLHQTATSWSYLSLKMVENWQPEGRIPDLLLIGAGAMVEKILLDLPKFRFGAIGITNRNQEKASRLAEKHHLQLVDWEERFQAFVRFPVILCAVSAESPVIRAENVQQPTERHKLLIDLGMLPGLDPRLAENYYHTLLNLQDISWMARRQQERKKTGLEEAREVIQRELTAWTINETVQAGVVVLPNKKQSLLDQGNL